jgi:ribosome-associated translation inhibitor RaiA
VDDVCDKLESQIRRHKEKVKDHKKAPHEERPIADNYGVTEPS